MPRLRVLAGPGFHDLTEIEVNSGRGIPISTDLFEGCVAVYLKGFLDREGSGAYSYFESLERAGKSWSIQFQGRFLKTHSADDILVGAAFDRPLSLPWGFSVVTSFMQYRDPTLQIDVASDTPSALAPLITTMPHLAHTRVSDLESFEAPEFPPSELITDDISGLQYASGHQAEVELASDAARQSYFADSARRKSVTFGSQDLITADFCHGHLDITAEGISVQVPGGFSFNMMNYWDGKPVRFICCERAPKGETVDGMPWGKVFWCVALEAVEDSDVVSEL